MMNENEILESLKCPVCIDFAEEPIECLFCNNIFCKKCITLQDGKILVNSCPMCRKEPNFKESAFAKRLLGTIPVGCSNECGVTISRSELNNHLLKCVNKKFNCSRCEFIGNKEEFLKHLLNEHETEIINYFDKNTTKNNITNTPIKQNDNIINPLDNNSFNLLLNNNNISPLVNRNGFPILVSRSGKYYCGQMTNLICGCCDGHCGPDDGCCCVACMDLICSHKKLEIGMLVNNYGLPAKWNKNSFFCGISYTKETKNFFGKVNLKNLKCEFPNEGCIECQKLCRQGTYYLPLNVLQKLIPFN